MLMSASNIKVPHSNRRWCLCTDENLQKERFAFEWSESWSATATIYLRSAQPLRDCREHYVYFYELQSTVSLRYFYFLHCFCSASTH